MSTEEFQRRKREILKNLDSISQEYDRGRKETERVEDVRKNTKRTLDDLDEEFCKKTGLTKTDAAFLFVAAGLQMIRQYVLTNFPERLDDQTAAKNTWGHRDEHSDRMHRYYDPSIEEIITNPVPFDANIGANGSLRGGGRMGHRVTAIGHDPLLGLVFGTANIATSTLTTSSLESYHIYTNDMGRDYFRNQARTELVLGKTIHKLTSEGREGKMKVGISLVKEIVHLNSDLHTKNSLPLPAVAVFDSKLATSLADYGLDMSNVITIGKQGAYAAGINMLIAMLHRLYGNPITMKDKKNYEVRTRKILSYSNLIATSSNVAVVIATRNVKLADIGGAAETIRQLITNKQFIRQVKEEFIFGTFQDMVLGNI